MVDRATVDVNYALYSNQAKIKYKGEKWLEKLQGQFVSIVILDVVFWYIAKMTG
jgi:hypothetical protein